MSAPSLTHPLRIGTRGSELALAQSRGVARELQQAWPGLEVRLVVIRTRGDALQDRALSTFGGKGVFTLEIEEALLDGRVDLAVHSLKDLPGTLPDGLVLAPAPLREDPRDCLVGPPLEALPSGARVGTGSPRRRAQLLALRPDLRCQEIRGNLPTRIRKWREGQYEALVLAMAGLKRLGFEAAGVDTAEIHPLEPESLLPAPGQGLLGLEHRQEDARVQELLAPLADPPSHAAAQAERAFLETLQAGCQAPVAAYARCRDEALEIQVLRADPQTGNLLRRRLTGTIHRAADLGQRAARALLAKGADHGGTPGTGRPLEGRRVVVTRTAEQAGELSRLLAARGALPVLVPTIRIDDPEDPAPLEQALADLEGYDWLVFTSPNAPRRFAARIKAAGGRGCLGAEARVACIGPATARACEEIGLRVDLVPGDYLAEGLLEAFRSWPVEGRRILVARAAEARDVLPRTLAERGARVDVVPLYRTVPLETLPPEVRADLLVGVDLVTVTASSVVRAFHRLTAAWMPPRTTPLVAIGPITARTARELGYTEVTVAEEATLESLVGAVEDRLVDS